MNFFKFGIEKKWGIQTFLISYSDIRCFRVDVEPSFVCIHFLDQKVEGFLDEKLYNFSVILREIETKTCEYFVLSEQLQVDEEGDEDE